MDKVIEVKCPKCAEVGMDILAEKLGEEITCSVCQEQEEYEQG
jgi:formylmethanofuran dehydrogenase subunit E